MIHVLCRQSLVVSPRILCVFDALLFLGLGGRENAARRVKSTLVYCALLCLVAPVWVLLNTQKVHVARCVHKPLDTCGDALCPISSLSRSVVSS